MWLLGIEFRASGRAVSALTNDHFSSSTPPPQDVFNLQSAAVLATAVIFEQSNNNNNKSFQVDKHWKDGGKQGYARIL